MTQVKGLYSQFKSDENVEKDGLFLEYGDNSHGQPMRIRIARAGGSNVQFGKSFERHSKPYKRLLQIGQMEEEQNRRLMLNVYLDAVIKGWENVEDREGNPLPFSRVNAETILTDLPDLFQDIMVQAGNAALFRETINEDDSGN